MHAENKIVLVTLPSILRRLLSLDPIQMCSLVRQGSVSLQVSPAQDGDPANDGVGAATVAGDAAVASRKVSLCFF